MVASVKYQNSKDICINSSEYVMPIPSNMEDVVINQAANGNTAIRVLSLQVKNLTECNIDTTKNMKMFSSNSHVVALLSVCD